MRDEAFSWSDVSCDGCGSRKIKNFGTNPIFCSTTNWETSLIPISPCERQKLYAVLSVDYPHICSSSVDLLHIVISTFG